MKSKLSNYKKGVKRLAAAAMALCLTVTGLVLPKTEVHAEMRDAWTITRDMKAGWNLGNSLESEIDETYWENPKTTKAMIDKIRERGFTSLRIPVRWDDHYTDTSSHTIDENYMKRVKEVVNYGINNGMYVILNVHHNDLQTKVSTEDWQKQQVKDELWNIWIQIANYFKGYDDKLIFEVNNEPRQGEDWGGNSALYACVNEYNETALAAIRSTDGNNKRRLVLLPTYCASSDEPKLAGFEKPSYDDMVAVSIHAYVPFSFAYEGRVTQWSDSLYNELKGIFARYKNYFLDKGIPVVIGEFGATNMNNTYDREQFAAAYAGLANSYGIPCLLWDNNRFGVGPENYGLFDRNTLTFVYGGIADAVINAYRDNGDPYKSLFWSETGASASNWEQAVSIETTKNGGSFAGSDITPGGYFYIEYSGTENEVEFILQSYSPKKWEKVDKSDNGTANGHYFVKYSYDNCVKAFGASDFNGLLDQIHVGATNHSVTVYSVCYCYPR